MGDYPPRKSFGVKVADWVKVLESIKRISREHKDFLEALAKSEREELEMADKKRDGGVDE